MTEQPQPTGADLARIALAQYRATAPKNTGPGRKKPTRRRTDRAGGRDPIGLGTVLETLNVDHEWNVGLAGGNLLDQWATLCPMPPGTVQAVAYDPASGRLEVRPASHAYATQLRLLGQQFIGHINAKAGRDVVRDLRVLPVGAVQGPDAHPSSTTGPDGVPEPGPVKTRDIASPGYRQARAAITRTTHGPAAPAGIEEVRARQENALRAHREPETAFTDGMAEVERLEEQERRRNSAEAVHQAALARARGAHKPIRTAFGTRAAS